MNWITQVCFQEKNCMSPCNSVFHPSIALYLWPCLKHRRGGRSWCPGLWERERGQHTWSHHPSDEDCAIVCLFLCRLWLPNIVIDRYLHFLSTVIVCFECRNCILSKTITPVTCLFVFTCFKLTIMVVIVVFQCWRAAKTFATNQFSGNSMLISLGQACLAVMMIAMMILVMLAMIITDRNWALHKQSIVHIYGAGYMTKTSTALH